MTGTAAERWAAQQRERRVEVIGEHAAGDWESLVAELLPTLGPSGRETVLGLMTDAWRQAPRDGLCGWGHAELGRLTKLARDLAGLAGTWRKVAKVRRRDADQVADGDLVVAAEINHAVAETLESAARQADDLLGRPGRKGPHGDHLLAAQWHLAEYVAATRGPGRERQ